MRLCVIGNSHVAALRAGLDRSGLRRAGSVDWFAIPGGYGPALVLDGWRLRARDPAARVETSVDHDPAVGLDLSVYDQVLFSAAGLPAARRSFVNHVLVAQAHAGWLRDGTGPADVAATARGSARPVSAAVLSLAIAGALRPMHGLRSLGDLARALPGRITVQPVPLPVRGVLSQPDCPLGGLYGDDAGPFLAWAWRVQQAQIGAMLADLGARAGLLNLPDPAWLGDGFTPDAYAEGDDGWHLNADYGARVLDQWQASWA